MKRFFLIALIGVRFYSGFSQEGLKPLTTNLNYIYKELDHSEPFNVSSYSLKTSTASLQIPFLEDFHYATKSRYADMKLWNDSSVYINSGYPIAPPSIGVATFDGLNQYGYPYDPNDPNLTDANPADTLSSKPINLYQSGNQLLQISDSLALSFYYQARGNGEPPEITDSLILDFYNPTLKIWKSRVWFMKGNSSPNTNDTAFHRAFVWINNAVFLKDSFQFRFRNRATSSGNFDHWHLDYVYLNKNRSMKGDTVYNDLTFGNVPSSFLQNYSAMPYQQYNFNEMAQRNSVRIKNNGFSSINMSYENSFYDKTNNIVHTYFGGANNLTPFNPNGYSTYGPHSNPQFGYTFPIMSDSADYTIKHYLYRAVGPGSTSDFINDNDTIYQKQMFRNYYAYDDGSSEGGYYINGVAGKMAIKFTVNYVDTLRAVQIYFDPAGSIANVEQNSKFRIYLWSDGGGSPGSVIYFDSLMLPNYYDSIIFKPCPTYSLTSKVILGQGTYYIGIRQYVPSGIVVGFDKNQDHHQNLYYDSGLGWNQSSINGSLMLHPVFGKFIPPPVSVRELEKKSNVVQVFPNPANDLIYFQQQGNKILDYVFFNALGQKLAEIKSDEQTVTLPISEYNNGVYFLRIKENHIPVQRVKIIIQH